MSRLVWELECLQALIGLAALKADYILESLKVDTKCPENLDMILLDTISELYLMKTPITLAIGSMT